jgi:O-antigen ligase
LRDDTARSPLRRHFMQRHSSALGAFAPMQPQTGYARSTSHIQARREGIFRKAAFFFLWLLMFVIPWENAVVVHGFGTISRVVGIPAFGMALLAILECGILRMLAPQLMIMLSFLAWGGFTYFWSFEPSATVTAIYTFLQLFMMVWLIWEFAQTRKEQLLLLRAYVLGSIVSSVGTLLGFFNNTGLQSGRYSGLGFNPGDLAFVLALAIPISLYLAVQERRKILVWVDGAATVLAFCAIVLTASRGSLVACAPTLLMFPFLFPKLRWGRNLLMLVLIALAGVGSWLFMPESSWSRLSTIGTEISSGTLNERTMIWQIGWQVFGRAPFQGVGAGAYAPAIEHTLGLASDVAGTQAGAPVARLVAHNTFFSILVEQGAIGFVLFLVLVLTLVLSAWKLPRVERVFWLCILLTWAIGALDLTWEQRKPTWFIFGLLIAVTATKLAPEARSLRKSALRRRGAEFYGQAPLPAEISRSQGLS